MPFDLRVKTIADHHGIGSVINYRFQIVRMLGEGGSGVVYLAEDRLRNGLPLALKVLHRQTRPEGESDAGFRNEVSVLMDLQHPHLVRVHDFGKIREADDPSLKGLDFLTMEYVEGIDVLKWFDGIAEMPMRARMLSLLLVQALGVLFYVHREGVIHFDIKPQNFVVLGPPGTDPPPFLKLIDFGLSASTQGPAGTSVRGTLEYAAPELLRGGQVDDRIDLYSLGATFYRLVEGRCPFEAETPVELVKKVLADEPRFGEAFLHYPAAVVDVIRVLLRKDPAHRYRDALEAVRVLASAQEQRRWREFACAKGGRFVGRTRQVQRIRAALSALSGRESEAGENVLVLSGPAGMGKSGLLVEAAKIARGCGLVVAETRAPRDDVPFQSIFPALRLLEAEANTASAEGRELVARSRQVFDTTAGGSDENAIEKLIRARAQFIIECGRVFPFVLVADDAAWMDQASMQILRTVALGMVPGTIVILAADAGSAPPLFPEGSFLELRLDELQRHDIEEMCAAILGKSPGVNRIAHGLYRYYGGTPGVMVQALRTLTDTIPDDTLDDEGKAEAFVFQMAQRLPVSIEEFLVSRLHNTSREEQLILAVLSCFHHPAPAAILEAVLPIQHGRLDTLTRILEFGGSLGSFDNHGRLFIRLEGLKKAVYESIAEDRTELHASIARAMKERLPSPSFMDLQETAHQLEAGGDARAASAYFAQAADEGVRLFAYPRSIELYRRALASAGSDHPVRTREIRVKLAETLYRSGVYDEAVEVSSAMLRTTSQDDPLVATLLKILGLSQFRLGHYEDARSNLQGALLKTGHPAGQMELRQHLVAIEISAGRLDHAEKESLRLLDEAKVLGFDHLKAAIDIDLGITMFLRDRFDDSIGYFHDALDVSTRLGDHASVIHATTRLGLALRAKGELERAVVFWEDALQMCGEHGTSLQQAQLHTHLGQAYFRLRKYDRARAHYHHALRLSTEARTRLGQASARNRLGEVCLAEGDYETALKWFSDARAMYAETGDAHGHAESTLLLASFWMCIGALAPAAELMEEADKQVAASGETSLAAQRAYLKGILFMKRGESKHAMAMLRQAQFLFVTAGEPLKGDLAGIRQAESLALSGNHGEAVRILEGLIGERRIQTNPEILAEAYFILGNASIGAPDALQAKPITLYKKGLEACRAEPVTEITWKLAFSLALEYRKRGLHARAKESFQASRLVLNHFLSHITSPELRTQYLYADGRQDALSTAEKFLFTT